MEKMRKKSPFLVGLTFILLAGFSYLAAQEAGEGTLTGYVYEKDGTTPVVGAIVKIKNLSDGTIYISGKTDANGFFRISRVKEGFYVAGIATPFDNFNSNNLIAIKSGETGQVIFALSDPAEKPYVSEDLPPKNEVRIGYVLKYDIANNMAWIFIEEGTLHKGDNIRFKSLYTDFYQKVEKLFVDVTSPAENTQGNIPPDYVPKLEEVDEIIAGNVFVVEVKDPVRIDDFVYLVHKKKSIFAFFITPCGVASVLAGSAAIISIIKKPEEEPEVSPFRH
ncbi:MAG: carboxypeptidase regulatory-like domain-containing protein [Candidatus Aminicenantes bacterium]|nr:carboxypeptidase regulatory-like domain-containing protein [Candidatus Aminicenantes bacterium]